MANQPNTKTLQQFRVEGMNVNGVECNFISGDLTELKQTINRTLGGDVEFSTGDGADEHGIPIFRRGERSNPVGWISPYFVPEAMSVTNRPRLRQVA